MDVFTIRELDMSELFHSAGGAGSMPVKGSLLQQADSLAWQDSGSPGFLIKPLLEDPARGLRTWLMKVEAGAWSPLHSHSEIEQVYVLEGSFYDQDGSYGPGDYVVRAAGAEHSAGSESGALVLLFYSPH